MKVGKIPSLRAIFSRRALAKKKLARRRLCLEGLESRELLAVSWINPLGGNWGDVLNWSTGALPGSNDDVAIDTAVPATISIRASDSITIHSLRIGPKDNVAMSGGSLAAGTGVTVDGQLSVTGGSFLGETILNVNAGGSAAISGGNFVGGTRFNVAAGVTVDLTGGWAVTYSGTLTGSGPGTVQLSEGELQVGSGGMTLAFPEGMFQWTGGTINAIEGTVTNRGTIDVAGSGVFTGMLDNFGTVLQSAPGVLEFRDNYSPPVPSSLIIEPGAFYLISAGGGVAQHGDGFIRNLGTVRKFGSTVGGASIWSVTDLDNSGTLEVSVGTMYLAFSRLEQLQQELGTLTGGTWKVLNGAILRLPGGTAVPRIAADVTLDGPGSTITELEYLLMANRGSFTLTGGADFTAPSSFTNSGRLTLGPGSELDVTNYFTQTATGTFCERIAGTAASGQYGRLDATAGATLDGTFEVALADGVVPEDYVVMTYPSCTGTFATYNGVAGLFMPLVGPTQMKLSALEDVTDLAVSSVSAPTAVSAGAPITVTWQVTAAGTRPAEGSWRDSVYLSTTPTVTPNSILLGSVAHSGGLAVGGSYPATLTASTPGVPAGDYYVLVKSDSTYQIPDQNRTNNTAPATTGAIHIAVPVLELGTPYSDAIPEANQGRYYQVTAPGTGHLVLRLDDADDQGVNHVYARLGTPPTPGVYDYRQPDVSAADQQVFIPVAAAGTWYVWVYGSSLPGAYTIRADAVPLTELVPGTPYADTFTATDRSRYYQVTVPAGQNLLLTLDDADNAGRNELYARFGAPPTRGAYDHRSQDVSGADQRIFIPGATAGTWYVLAYGASGSGEYTLRADTSSLELRDVTPRRQGTSMPLELTLSGGGFTNPLTIELVSAGGASFSATRVEVDSFAQVVATFAAGAVPPGTYTVRVTRPGIDSDTLSDAVQIVAGGQAHLEADFVLPADLGRHAPATLYVDYANTGDLPMPAPLLMLGSGDPDGSDRPLLSLDGSRMVNGLWTSGNPKGFGNSVQFLASGATPGVLQPGESVRVPVYYAGLEQPWEFDDDQVEFELGALTADDNSPIDWAAVKDCMRPDYVCPEAWDVVWTNFTGQVGSTWGSYLAAMDENAVYLSRLGQRVEDVTFLQALEFREADGLNPLSVLAAGTDAAVAAPGLPLVFERYYGQPISHRYEPGPLGRGWVHNWQYSLSVAADGTVSVKDMSGTPRIFQPDLRPGRSYLPAPGDNGALSKLADGSFQLRELDGSVSAYRADGKLDYVEDTNGNRITCSYTGTLLTSLTHSAGQVVAIGYNAAGRINSVTDPDGRQTLFTYDAANEHLVSVQGYDGRVTGYSYNPAHAITEIALPGGTHQYYTYDTKGRLASASRDGGAEQVTFSYDTTGRVSASDALGGTSRYWIDHWARIAKTENALGSAILKQFDAGGNLTAVIDPAGRASSYAYDSRRNLIRATDALGHTTRFTYGSDSSRVASITDAKGNPTTYRYDAKGNVISIIYADGSGETWTYFGNGEVKSWTNRRGNDTPGDPNDGVVGFTYNADGQLTRKSFADGSQVDYAYDSRGNLTQTLDARGTTNYAYYADDSLRRIEYPGGQWLEFTYDAAGRRASSLDQLGHRLDYHYDAVGRLASVTDEAPVAIVAYQYDAKGQLVRKTVGNGLYTTYEYDLAGQLLHLVNQAADGGEISRFDYTYDLRGRRTTMNTLDGIWNYSYDEIGQLTHAVFTPAVGSVVPVQDLAYTYDAMGNRVRTVENGVTTEYTTNNLNQYTRVGDTTYTFDKDGNLINETSPAGTITYSYDDENRLVALGRGTDTWRYTYDALGERVAATTNGTPSHFVIDPVGLGDLVGQYDASGNLLARYDYGFGLLSQTAGGSTGYYLFDAIGSTQQVVSATGAVANRYHYDPFGKVVVAELTIGNPFQFVGERGVMSDASGRNYMRARYYAPNTGTFISMDPLGAAADSNLYRYAYNSPTLFVDPLGTDCYINSPDAGFGGFYNPGIPGQVPPFVVINSGGGDLSYIATLRVHEETHRRGGSEVEAYSAAAEYAFRVGRPDLGRQWLEEAKTAQFTDPYRSDKNKPKNEDALVGQAVVKCAFAKDPIPPLTPEMEEVVSKWAKSTRPKDPNQKIGPAGVGAGAYVTPGQPFSYRVDYENDASATAPAQVVTVTDNLDPDLDWSSFELTEVGFGDQLVQVPAGLRHFETAVPISFGGLEFEVRIDVGLRLETGEVYANFYSVDPATGLPPPVEIGFLPPEDGTGRGMGHFGYVIRPKAGLVSGTEIRNVARIQFDYGEIIATNQVAPHDPSQGTDPAKECLNTIDAGVPASSVLPLAAVTLTASFPVQWAGQDETGGSGVAKYDIYVSDNGAASALWLNDTALTTATFTGQFGHRYSFYSVASDQVGHQEAAPATADTETLLSPPAVDTIGVYVPDNSAFYLHDRQDGGDAEHVFVYGVAGVGWKELMGDWNGDGQDTPGMYDPATGMWYLTNKLEPGDAEYTFMFGIAGQGWKPLVGDWDADGKDSIAIYEPATSLFFFKNTLAGGDADEMVQFGVGSLGWIPIGGDWDGIASNGDGFGFYEPAISAFWLKNARTPGPAEECFQFGMGSLGWTVLAGNWDGLPGDGVGFYVPETAQFFLKNAHTPGPADTTFTYGIGGAGWRPLVGCWQTSPAASPTPACSPAAVDQLDLAALASQQLQPSIENSDLDLLFGTLGDRRGRTVGRR